jgi:hypothetical protein
MKTCAACGTTKRLTGLGNILLCPDHYQDIRSKAEALHAEGKTVDVGKIAREMFLESYSVGSYILRDIPTELWDTAKHRSIDDGVSLRELLLTALQDYLSK